MFQNSKIIPFSNEGRFLDVSGQRMLCPIGHKKYSIQAEIFRAGFESLKYQKYNILLG